MPSPSFRLSICPQPAFTGRTTGQISAKLHKDDQYQPYVCMPPACSASMHKKAVRAKGRKALSGFHRSNCWRDFDLTPQGSSLTTLLATNRSNCLWDFNKLGMTVTTLVGHAAVMFHFAARSCFDFHLFHP